MVALTGNIPNNATTTTFGAFSRSPCICFKDFLLEFSRVSKSVFLNIKVLQAHMLP